MFSRLRRAMLLLGTTILVLQTAFMPIGMYSAETTMDTDEHEPVELPSTRNSLEELTTDPNFSFQPSDMQGVVNSPIHVTISSDQEVSEVKVRLPEEATIVKEQLSEGTSVVQGEQPYEWTVQSESVQIKFELPLVFEKAGNYELSMEETTTHIEISKQENTTEETPVDNTESSNDDLPENTQEQKTNENNQVLLEVDKKAFASSDLNTNVRVTKYNFLEHFDLHGTASYESETGELTLTTATNYQSGNATLQERINVHYPFILKGKANIGSNANGADGMAFGFHRSDNSAVGNSGNGMGIAGLTGGFGFKLDSFFNTWDGLGAARDPAALGGAPFAGYVYHETNGLLTTYMGSDAPAKRTGTLNGDYDDIVIEYLPSEETNIFRINYKGETWERDISNWQGIDTTALSFLISGSTGASNNIHSFMFEQMDYVIGTGEVEVSYRDADTNEEIIPGQLLEIPFKSEAVLNPNSGTKDEPYLRGYDYSHVETDALYFDEINNIIQPETERRNVTYFFNRAESQVKINYIDDVGKVISSSNKIIGYVNEELELAIKEIEHYRFLFEKDNKPMTTTITRDEQTYWLVYALKESPPLDPLDPESEVDPENKPELPEDQGLLSIDFASTFNFGTQAVSIHDQTYYAQPQRLMNEDGTVNENEKRPNYVQISDRRPENERNGWQLAVTQNGQFKTNQEEELQGARLSFTNQALATAQGGIVPELQQTNPLALVPDVKRVLVMAQGEEGTGTWIYRFGDQETAGSSVALTVPKGSNPHAKEYKTSLTWELSAVPDNE